MVRGDGGGWREDWRGESGECDKEGEGSRGGQGGRGRRREHGMKRRSGRDRRQWRKREKKDAGDVGEILEVGRPASPLCHSSWSLENEALSIRKMSKLFDNLDTLTLRGQCSHTLSVSGARGACLVLLFACSGRAFCVLFHFSDDSGQICAKYLLAATMKQLKRQRQLASAAQSFRGCCTCVTTVSNT